MTADEAAVRADALRKAAAMLRSINGPDPSQAAEFDRYDVSAVQEASQWDGVEWAASTLEEYVAKVLRGAGPS